MGSNHPVIESRWAGDHLVWVEKQSDGTVLRELIPGQAVRDLPVTHTIRGGLFYGGGELACSPNSLVYTEKSGQLHQVKFDGLPERPITPRSGRSAAPVISKDETKILYIHTDGQTDSLRMVDLTHPLPNSILLNDRADFFMQPAIHPDGSLIAWVEWDHPDMPWQNSRLMTGVIRKNNLRETQLVAGIANTPVFQPEFSPDGCWLSYLSTIGEWDSLILVNLKTKSQLKFFGDRTLMEPAWVQGLRTYCWLPDSSGLLQMSNDRGINHLWRVMLDGSISQIDLTPYTSCSQLSLSPDGQRISLMASATSITPRLIVLQDDRLEVIHNCYAQDPIPELLPSAHPVQWNTPNGEVYGIYYPPCGLDQPEELPAAIIHIHSGPTRQVDSSFSADTTFFTSRGMAVLSVNYHGSTGYGRSYRDALNGRWGDIDVEDTVSAVQFLIENQLADPARLVIKGSSAGGYTLLNTLIRYPGVFKCGICAYGVSNLLSIVDETFKYEAHYYDSLIGPLPEARQKYIDWSPVNHADQIRDPLAIFQGAADEVVPLSQAEQIVQTLTASGTPFHYHVFEGEGHGWRKSETQAAYYAEMEQFLQKYVGR